MARELTPAQLKHVLKPYIATLATLRADGSPHMAPVWFRYEGGVFKVLTDRGSQKHVNITRDPRVELCIDDRERPPYHTVIVRGRARVEESPGAAWRAALAVHYLGEERGKRYVEQTPDDNGIMVVIEPERFVGW
jgi:PPOX class probable F420-dependent enzyme